MRSFTFSFSLSLSLSLFHLRYFLLVSLKRSFISLISSLLFSLLSSSLLFRWIRLALRGRPRWPFSRSAFAQCSRRSLSAVQSAQATPI